MGSGTLKDNAAAIYLVNKQPVCLDVTFAAAHIVADKLMLPMLWIKSFAGDQFSGNVLKPSFFFAAGKHLFKISLELPGENGIELHEGEESPSFLNISSASLH
jgi:hypothetical protein